MFFFFKISLYCKGDNSLGLDSFCKEIKTTFHPFRKFVFDLTPKGESRHPQAGVICGPSQNVYDGEKKFSVVSEKIGVKDLFSLGAISPLNGGKAVEKKSCVILARKSKFSKKSFHMVYVLCTFDDVINFWGVR